MRLRKKKYKPVELFESINQVIQHNWEQLSITGEPKWLMKNESDWDEKINAERYKELFFKLHDEFSELTGGSDVMEQWSILMVKRMEARAKFVNGDLIQINFINLYTSMIDSLMEGSEDVNIIKSRMIVQKYYGLNIDHKSMTVPEYQSIVEIVRENQQTSNGTDGED